jgi:hypothetical protein
MKSYLIIVGISFILITSFTINSNSIVFNNRIDLEKVKIKKSICKFNDSTYLSLKSFYINVPDTVCSCPFGLITLKQEIEMVIDNKKILINNPVKRRENIEYNGRNYSVLQNVIIRGKWIQNENGLFLLLEGNNNLQPTTLFYGILNDQGEWIFYQFHDMVEIFQSYGNHNDLETKYRITNKDFQYDASCEMFLNF